MTPILRPTTSAEKKYNEAHIKTRNCVERCIGLLKGRWRCLQRGLNYSPKRVSKIVLVCAVLHNLCIYNNIDWENNVQSEDILPQIDTQTDHLVQDGPLSVYREAQALRNAIINNMFE